ncbi:glycoside hydrolase family 88 protein [Paenarthrobacter sp. AMU7]|uniref:Glycoside hydrolase family 88 protein n=1 Tax=Paenarthrobacter sp. AMU7 TaxID=3162492 RepID=A0AB39YQ29_9MICC
MEVTSKLPTERLTSFDAASKTPHQIAVGLYNHYNDIEEIKAYYGVLAIYGLARAAVAATDEALLDRVEEIVRRFPDEVSHPHYNFPSYSIGGIAQAFLSSIGRTPDRAVLLRDFAEELMTAPRNAEGIIKLPGTDDSIWIDAAMASSPFLLYAGLALDEPRYVDEAITQSVKMYDAFLNKDNGLLHQCRSFVAPGVLSQDHWGRGNGWGIFALAELLRGLPVDAPRRSEVESRFVALCTALLPHQTLRGLWRQEIPLQSAWEEASGTGLILYSFGVGIEQGILTGTTWADAVVRGLNGLSEWCINQDYSTENSCPGTLCPGTGDSKGTVQAYVELPVPHQDEHHSFSALILALSVAPVVGVEDLQLRATPQSTAYLPAMTS